MELLFFIFNVMPLLVTSISVSSNGNSPEVKMTGGMMVDIKKNLNSRHVKLADVTRNGQGKSRGRKLNHTMLSINERYRRLIPYMTFYYANDGIVTTTANPINDIDFEIEKAQIIEAPVPTSATKKIIQSTYRNVPRYQGNRLTEYNIASSNPPRILEGILSPYYSRKVTPNYNPLVIEQKFPPGQVRFPQKSNVRIQETPSYITTRPPLVNLYQEGDNVNVGYYYSEKDPTNRFQLIPYEQTPVQVVTESINLYKNPIQIENIPYNPKDQVYVKLRPNRPQHIFDIVFEQQAFTRKPAITGSGNYYGKSQPAKFELKTAPVVETGFKPIVPQIPVQTTESIFLSTTTPRPLYEDSRPVILETVSVAPEITVPYAIPNYYQYVVDNRQSPDTLRDSSTLSEILSILQKSKSLPKPVTRENLSSSIRTLLHVLNELKAAPYSEAELPVLSTARPFAVTPKPAVGAGMKPVSETSSVKPGQEFQQEPYLATVNPPSQHLDDYPAGVVTSQKFPLPISSDDEGGTPGRPGVDYPTLTTIPQTQFNCKTQRYKGFFADPETRCQVWHYCDLNGGQASFLCPNGTIFSQAGLTCDWWFNVRCASAAQLYVLNESLYKYILPHSPKFPEDYSGPLVDRYLMLKFKEMEEQFSKNKSKQTASEKMATGSDEENSKEDNSAGATEPNSFSEANKVKNTDTVSEASVIVDNSGRSGNVERLQE